MSSSITDEPLGSTDEDSSCKFINNMLNNYVSFISLLLKRSKWKICYASVIEMSSSF